MTDLTELASRVEAAGAGGSFALDTQIAYAINAPLEGIAKPYTASLDAAMTLVPEAGCWNLDTMTGRCQVYRPFGGLDARGCAATPALALTAACLRARAAMGEG